MTSHPAKVFGIKDRGRIAEGLAADVTIFDPATVGSAERNERLFDLPGGGKRLVLRSTGINYTNVNGEIVYRDGEMTGAMSGEVLHS